MFVYKTLLNLTGKSRLCFERFVYKRLLIVSREPIILFFISFLVSRFGFFIFFLVFILFLLTCRHTWRTYWQRACLVAKHSSYEVEVTSNIATVLPIWRHIFKKKGYSKKGMWPVRSPVCPACVSSIFLIDVSRKLNEKTLSIRHGSRAGHLYFRAVVRAYL